MTKRPVAFLPPRLSVPGEGLIRKRRIRFDAYRTVFRFVDRHREPFDRETGMITRGSAAPAI
jgi:hypothetical protein